VAAHCLSWFAAAILGSTAQVTFDVDAMAIQAGVDSPRPEFEVASLKPNASGAPGYGIATLPGGGLRARNIHLKRLIAVAYAVTDFQVFGNVPWLESERYDLDAKAPGPADLPQLRLMLQSLLADRFQLKIHREPKELSIYSLIPAKGAACGPGIVEAPEGDCAATASPQAAAANGTICGVVNINPNAGWIRGHRARVSQLADRLTTLLGRTVVDKTGLSGIYDINLTWTPEPGLDGSAPTPANTDSSAPALATALQQQLGVKLVSGKGPVEAIVIDSAAKATPN
jgi:uncharacterized protein (TIGR03435 family)